MNQEFLAVKGMTFTRYISIEELKDKDSFNIFDSYTYTFLEGYGSRFDASMLEYITSPAT